MDLVVVLYVVLAIVVVGMFAGCQYFTYGHFNKEALLLHTDHRALYCHDGKYYIVKKSIS